jgi:EAL domain-containing protein (putative c-di-GMP-specific phosphodiesterase class I)/GGDEF domain-containing protein
VKILAHVRDEGLRRTLEEAAGRLDAEVIDAGGAEGESAQADAVVVELDSGVDLSQLRARANASGTALVAVCHNARECESAAIARADDWILLPAQAPELALRIGNARARAQGVASPRREEELVELLRYQELLYDKLTGFPTLPVMIQHARELIDTRGELTVLYIHFVWYSKIEELYGWQKLDEVLESSAAAVREFYAREHPSSESLMLVSHVGDDDFILFTHIPMVPALAEQRLKALSGQLEGFLRTRIEAEHGQEIAALCGIYVGTATIFRNPKIRTERLVYRGIREAASAARGAEEWERSRKVADLKDTLREGAVYIEYHPIIVTQTERIYGYEALARGSKRELRSPQVLFEVAEEANLLWELGRLLRQRAVEGIRKLIDGEQFLFLNVDPHDFDDPAFRDASLADLGIPDPRRVVLEITERTAIKDYPRFQEYLAAFRERGFRFAVDDAGSGYAGLGSIANLAPDYIKLDISLISNIDTNFLKQNLVETMVRFAEGQGAQVIAEGVERREEFETVRDLGVHLTQGFLFHKPQRVAA